MAQSRTNKTLGRDERRAPTPPQNPSLLAWLSFGVSLLVVFFCWWVLRNVQGALEVAKASSFYTSAGLIFLGVSVLLLLLPSLRALGTALRTAVALRQNDWVSARVSSAASSEWALYGLGYAAAVWLVFAGIQFVIANDVAVGNTFIKVSLIRDNFLLVLRAFLYNVFIFVLAEVLVLVWGLVVAIARLLPGKAGQPVRFLAMLYTDIFRGLPSVIVIYMVGFGVPLAIPGSYEFMAKILGNQDYVGPFLAVVALTLTYGAYVAEVYRSGIESIHPSQMAAARSLGLSFGQTLRFVIVPQAIRRIIPPLLNDFIGLQKDTALVNVIGVIDAFNQAKIIASNKFNLSAVTIVAILFVIITIPQARLVDRLLEHDQKRMRN